MVDPTRLRALLDRIDTEVAELQSLGAKGKDSLLLDATALAAAKYRLVVSIEAAIDSGQHIIASEGLEPPANYAEIFEILGRHKYLPSDQVPALMKMAGFRNLLVHGYADIDDAVVAEVVVGRLDDLVSYRRSIAKSTLDAS